jgi:RimJ/RimL family protein N-acetyltransferase
MERARFADFVDRFWADAFGFDVAELHAEPLRISTPAPGFADYRGVYVLTLGPTTLVSAPAGHVDADTVVLGPSQHAYLHRDDHVAAPGATTQPVDPSELASLRGAVQRAEWSEGGFGHDDDVTFGAYHGNVLVAAGNLTDFAGRPADVGLVTHPDHRGKGHGLALARDMTTWAFAHGAEVVRYRALTTNMPSLAIARRAGFTPYGSNVAIRMSA